MSNWLKQTPVYSTRPTGNGVVGSLWLSLWLQLSILMLAVFNAVGWGIYGLVELLSKVF